MQGFWYPLVLTVHLVVGIAVIGLVLMQHGKGADMGAAFGSGASGSLFGASGSANFLSRTTGILAAVFFLTSLTLSFMTTNRPKAAGSVMDTVKVQSAPAASTKSEVPAPLSGNGGSIDSKVKDIPK